MVVFEVLATAEMYIISVQWAVSTLPFSSLCLERKIKNVMQPCATCNTCMTKRGPLPYLNTSPPTHLCWENGFENISTATAPSSIHFSQNFENDKSLNFFLKIFIK